MPHPERTENGDQIFSSMKEFIQMGNPITDHDLAHNQESYRLKVIQLMNPALSGW